MSVLRNARTAAAVERMRWGADAPHVTGTTADKILLRRSWFVPVCLAGLVASIASGYVLLVFHNPMAALLTMVFGTALVVPLCWWLVTFLVHELRGDLRYAWEAAQIGLIVAVVGALVVVTAVMGDSPVRMGVAFGGLVVFGMPLRLVGSATTIRVSRRALHAVGAPRRGVRPGGHRARGRPGARRDGAGRPAAAAPAPRGGPHRPRLGGGARPLAGRDRALLQDEGFGDLRRVGPAGGAIGSRADAAPGALAEVRVLTGHAAVRHLADLAGVSLGRFAFVPGRGCVYVAVPAPGLAVTARPRQGCRPFPDAAWDPARRITARVVR